MKLLLTSAGVRNDSIAAALISMLDKPASEAKVVFVPTAANVELGSKDWFVNQLVYLWQRGFSFIDIVDPSAADVDWQPRMEEADVIFVNGGNTFHLLNQMRQTGFGNWLKENLGEKVYVGVSAGSIAACTSIEVATLEPADPNLPGLKDLTGIGLANLEVEPHCTPERFRVLEEWAKGRQAVLYAVDDQSAVQVQDGKVEVVSEGEWKRFGA